MSKTIYTGIFDYIMLDIPQNSVKMKLELKYIDSDGKKKKAIRKIKKFEIREMIKFFDDYIARYKIDDSLLNKNK